MKKLGYSLIMRRSQNFSEVVPAENGKDQLHTKATIYRMVENGITR